jgi:hemerythrin-like domain-containing protein
MGLEDAIPVPAFPNRVGLLSAIAAPNEVGWRRVFVGSCYSLPVRRDARLQGLSSDHHRALVLARRSARAAGHGNAAASVWREIQTALKGDLGRHFEIEERVLLPALRALGEVDLVEKTLADHIAIRASVGEERDVRGSLARFAALLTEHVRFEERVVFEVAQTRLPAGVLDEIAAASRRA